MTEHQPTLIGVDIGADSVTDSWTGAPNGEIQQTSCWAAYEARKRAFRAENPGASAADYDRFVDDLTAELGI